MGTTQDYKEKIATKLGVLEYQLKRYTDMGLTDEKKAMETIVCQLLNLIYGYSLVNLNNLQINYPAIDLGSEDDGIAVQVTSSNSREKVRDTLRKFESHELFSKFNRLIIFVTGERKDFSKEFSAGHIRFSPEHDIWDFHTLTEDIDRIQEDEFDKLKQIYDFLEKEYPNNTSENKWKKWIGAVLVSILALSLLWRVGTYCYEKYRDAHPRYAYETNMDWVSMEEAASILSSQSRVEVFKANEDNRYYKGAALTVLYRNLEDQDRYITRFTVHAENIEEDLSPKLIHHACTEEDNTVIHTFYNEGWGETGRFSIELVSVVPFDDDVDKPVKVSLREDACLNWEFESLRSGETEEYLLCTLDDFVVDYGPDFTGYARFWVNFTLKAPEKGYEYSFFCILYVSQDRINMEGGAGGYSEYRNYVVWVETSEPEWQKTYTVQQCLPANETVRLPIFIVPEKSCTMTVWIEFETMDGEIIEAVPLEKVYFYVPYYNDPTEYIDGSLLDWNQIDGTEVIYFPFRNVEAILP